MKKLRGFELGDQAGQKKVSPRLTQHAGKTVYNIMWKKW
jgi:hypothetical protein